MQFFRISILSALLFSTSLLNLQAAPVFNPLTGHWYEAVLVPDGITWSQSYTNAINRGGYLCTITNADENTFVASLVDTNYYSAPSTFGDILGPWLGGFRRAGEGTWNWVTGEPFSYAPWYPGQPDGYGGSDQRLQYYARFTTGSTWGDHPGEPISGFSLPRGYIVEYDAPKCAATQTNGVVQISWPSFFTNWTLETTPSLSTPILWTPISTNSYQTGAVNIFITVSNTSGNAFYRLRHD
jgi:hypothetical protein